MSIKIRRASGHRRVRSSAPVPGSRFLVLRTTGLQSWSPVRTPLGVLRGGAWATELDSYRSQIDFSAFQKSIPKMIAILIDFWSPKASKIGPKSIKNRSKHRCFFQYRFQIDFWSISGASDPWKWWFRIGEVLFFIKSAFRESYQKWSIFDPKSLQKSIKNRSTIISKFISIFTPILDRFWPPKWTPNPSKSLQKSIQRPPQSLQDTTQVPKTSQRPPNDPPKSDFGPLFHPKTGLRATIFEPGV